MMRVRFAPSPTGQLHVGNARTALFNWLLAHGHDGTLILRIEDTDAERSTRESEAGILEDLRWLGLDWDEGPDVGGPHGPYRQSERLHLYASYANELIASDHAYYCFCPPSKLEADRKADLAAGRPPKYHGTCRELSLEAARARIETGERPVIRFKVPPSTEVSFNDAVRGEVTFNTEVIGDPVLVRSDGRPAYNFAVVIDDALMEVTHVIRGEDHISNTPRQLLLYRALGFTPPQFAHLALVMGPDHTPLSKRHGATSVAEFRLRGYLPEALVNYLALIGWSPGASASDPGTNDELLPVAELARRFAIEDVGHAAGIFDVEKLSWMNRHYMKVAAPGRIAAESMRYFLAPGLRPEEDRCRARIRLVAAADGRGIGRSAGGDSRARAVRLRVRRGRVAAAARRRARGRGGRRAAGHCRPARRDRGAAARQGGVPRRRRARARAHRAEGQGVVPPDSRRADRIGRRPRARPGGAGDRPRRRAARRGRGGEDRQL